MTGNLPELPYEEGPMPEVPREEVTETAFDIEFNQLLGEYMRVRVFDSKEVQPEYFGACAGADKKHLYLYNGYYRAIARPHPELSMLDRALMPVKKLSLGNITLVELLAPTKLHDCGIKSVMDGTFKPAKRSEAKLGGGEAMTDLCGPQ